MKPRVFVGSSAKDIHLANAVHANLEYDADVTVWNQGIFGLSRPALESLLLALEKTDFGVFIFSPNDTLLIRGRRTRAVRDNVIFELGLFIGRLGKERTFFIQPRSPGNIRIPTDLLGITPATFDDKRQDKNWRASLGTACDDIRNEISQQSSSERHISYLATAPEIYEHALWLCRSAKQKIWVLQSFAGPRPPESYAEQVADILAEKKSQNVDVLFDAFLALDFKCFPPDFKERNEDRYQIYEQRGIRKRVTLWLLDLRLPMFDVFIVDRKHAHISFTTSASLPDLQRGIAFVNEPDIVGDLVEWFGQTIERNAIKFEKFFQTSHQVPRKRPKPARAQGNPAQ